jgi:Uma2 family endonuclease
MNAQTPQRATGVTIDDLLRLGSDRWVEVVNGEIREIHGGEIMSPGVIHSGIAANVYDILRAHVKATGAGIVRPDGLNYLLSVVAGTIRESRIPDVSFVRRERVVVDFEHERCFPGAPDLAVEIVSPHEAPEALEEKLDDYFAAGTEQIWVLYPGLRRVHVYERPPVR